MLSVKDFCKLFDRMITDQDIIDYLNAENEQLLSDIFKENK